MKNIERTIKAIFAKYPDAVIYFEYEDGEILFYPNAKKSYSEENLHSGYMRNGGLVDVAYF